MAVFNQNFYRVNSNNLALASSATGGTVDQPTEELGRLVLRPGTITCTLGSTSVTGSGTVFTANVQIGDVMQDAIGNNIGVVLSRTDTVVTLVSGSKIEVAAGSRYTSGNNTAILPTDSFLMRITVIKSPNVSVTVPNLSLLRTGTSEQILAQGALTNKSYIEFFAEGGLGTADVLLTPISLDCSLQNYYMQSEPVSNGIPNISLPVNQLEGFINTSNLAVSNFPNYLWYLINPLGSGDQLLATNTKYGIEVTDDLPALVLTQGTGFVDPRTHYNFVNSIGYRKY